MPVSPDLAGPVLISSLVVWRIYRRVRRNIGRQQFQPKRIIARLMLVGTISLLITPVLLGYPSVLLGFGTGLLAGALLGFVGLKLTGFEATAEGKFYTPNAYIGVALSLVLVARLAYRLTLLYTVPASTSQPVPGLMQSSLTLSLFGILAGYYIVYYLGVLMHCREPEKNPVQ
jgi:hypothetical protein